VWLSALQRLSRRDTLYREFERLLEELLLLRLEREPESARLEALELLPPALLPLVERFREELVCLIGCVSNSNKRLKLRY